MVNEFGNLQYTCSAADLVPSGLSVSSEFQTCAVAGARTGQLLVSGADYISAQYGFATSHLWRNVGINAALFAFFVLCTA